jgi:hypothetical protein
MEIVAAQSKGGFAMKTSAAIIIVVIWNVLLLPGFYGTFLKNEPPHFGLGMRLALGFMLTLSILLILSEPVRRLILKEGRDLDDIKRFAYFMILLSSLMLIMTSII